MTRFFGWTQIGAVPHPDTRQERHRDQGSHGNPRDRALTVGEYDKGCEQGTYCLSCISSDLKQGLSGTVTSARGHARNARCFGMKDRGTGSHQRCGDQHNGIAACDRKQQQTDQRRAHADREREGLRTFVCVKAHRWLQQRGGELKGERDQPNLREVKIELCFKKGVERWDERLNQVVEQMTKTKRQQYRHGRRLRTDRSGVRGGLCAGGDGFVHD